MNIFGLEDDGKLGAIRSQNAGQSFDVYENEERLIGGETLMYGLPRKRLIGSLVIYLLVVCSFFGKTLYLQAYQGAYYAVQAEENRLRNVPVPATRGLVFDKKGIPLIENAPSFFLVMRPKDLPKDSQERHNLFEQVAALAGISPTDLDVVLTQSIHDHRLEWIVKKGLSYESAMRCMIEEESLPGFSVRFSAIRRYRTSTDSFSHILGYTGGMSESEWNLLKPMGYINGEEVGKAGIERSMETLLHGVPGHDTYEVDARGRQRRLLSHEPPVNGANITLSIDADFQQFLQRELEKILQENKLHAGTVVAIDPNTGAIQALVSLPSYDSNLFAEGLSADAYRSLINDPHLPLFPRAWAGEFPAGSTFKPFVAFAALKERVISEYTAFLSSGGLSVGPWFFPDWKAGGHGMTDVKKALAESVNTFFYIVGGGYKDTTGLGVERIVSYAKQFGFGEKTGVELPGEADGFLPSMEWKEKTKGERWYIGDTYHLAIGQGDLLVTPLQLAVANAVVANGGKPIHPHLVEGIDGLWNQQLAPTKPKDDQPAFDPTLIRIVQEGMRQGVTAGSSRSLQSLPEPVAGKTGTAQAGGDVKTHAWFTGFGPYKKPTIALVVLVENGGEGSSVAVPIAKKAFEWWFSHEKE